jgi:hypothetical protein
MLCRRRKDQVPLQLVWILDEKGEEAGVSDLRPAIDSIGDRFLTISRKEARFGTQGQTLSLPSSPMLAYGSVEFIKAVRADFYPGKWADWTELRCERYFAKVGALLFNDDYLLLPAAEVKRRQQALLAKWGRLFLRPTRADKPFSGMVVGRDEWEEIERQLDKVEAYDLVVVAPAKEIEAEYRLVAVRGKGIVAASQYRQNAQSAFHRDVPSEAYQVAETAVKMIGEDFADPMYIVDIARHQDEFRLLEINGFSYAVFYACDLETIVQAAHEEALREWNAMQL